MTVASIKKLAKIIQEHRSWISVLETDNTVSLMSRSGVELKPVRRRVLSLVSTSKQGVYPRGHVWDLPDDKLDKAVRSLKQKDKSFVTRWKLNEITPADVEYIIRHASNGFLILNLTD
jgi:hypothetical protein